MKRVGYLFGKICDLENINMAIMKASLGKRERPRVRKILINKDFYAKKIQKMLVTESYKPSPYTIKKIFDGANKKERTIYKPRFYPDQIIHWSLMLILQPVIVKGMSEFTCGSVPKRGTGYAKSFLQKWLRDHEEDTTYCLKLDISKFYPSIDKDLLKGDFEKKIKDTKCLNLINIIIDSSDSGLPIGNYTSQWFSNFFLQGLDHYIKEELKIKYYLRYVDDLVLLSNNKKQLNTSLVKINEYLASKKLKLKKDWQLFHISKRFVDFLGFKFYRDKTTLRKRNSLRIKRRFSKISKKSVLLPKDAFAIISYWGWLVNSNSFTFCLKHVNGKVSILKAKGVISAFSKAGG